MEEKLENALALLNTVVKEVDLCKLKIANLEKENFELKAENAQLSRKLTEGCKAEWMRGRPK
jgi:regulator of replication initiation timing